MNEVASLGAEALMVHAGWMRSLARQLVGDAQAADDVVHQTLASALERPPAHDRNLRAWLGRSLANVARQFGRSDSRRARRERIASKDEALPSAAELVSQAELQRELVSAILRLDEPYRSTVLLRFYRDLPPGRCVLACFPDDFVFEPASFEVAPQVDGGKAKVGIRWRPR